MGSRPNVDLAAVEARRICIIKPSSLGDIVQTLPLLGALRWRFPDASITWLTNAQYAPLLDGHPELARVLRFGRNDNWLLPASWVRGAGLLGALQRSRFDLTLDLQGLLRTAVMTACTRSAVRVGLESAREGANLACNVVVPGTPMKLPAHARYWRVAEALGAGHLPQRAVAPVNDADQAWARDQLAKLVKPILAIHPGARWATKRWPVERFAAAANAAMERRQGSFVIVGGKAEQPLAQQLRQLLSDTQQRHPVLDLTGKSSLPQLAAVLERSAALLTNDSGPMHLSAAVGTPVAAVFTCTCPQRSGPPGNEHALISARVPCAASYKKRCPHRGERKLACMRELDAQRVGAALAEVLERACSGQERANGRSQGALRTLTINQS